MTEDEIVARGVVADTILRSEDILWFFNHWKSLILETIVSTAIDQMAERERLYLQYRNMDDVIGTMRSFVTASNQITKKHEQAIHPELDYPMDPEDMDID